MKCRYFFIFLVLFMAACAPIPGTETALAVVETVMATENPLPTASATSLTSPTPTRAVIPGTLRVQVNVRAGPGTTYDSLGLLAAGQAVAVIDQNPAGTWVQIVHAPAPQGGGWVAAQYVDVGEGVIPTQTLAVTATAIGPLARVTQKLNVRAGPGTSYDMLGTLEAETTVTLTGRNSSSAWLQVQFPAGGDGRGWISAAYVQAEDISGLPVLGAQGDPLTPQTDSGGTSVAASPTPYAPAFLDGDSAAQPLARVEFSTQGTRRFTHQDAVSYPDGDIADWLSFIPFALPGMETATMTASLSCLGTGTLTVELWRAGDLVTDWGSLACGDRDVVILLNLPGTYQFHLAAAPAEGVQFIRYTLTLRNDP